MEEREKERDEREKAKKEREREKRKGDGELGNFGSVLSTSIYRGITLTQSTLQNNLAQQFVTTAAEFAGFPRSAALRNFLLGRRENV